MTLITDIYNFRPVNEQLSTSGQPDTEQFGALAADAYEAIINLAPHNSPNALPEEADLVANLGMEYIHIPVRFDAPGENELFHFFQIMDTLRGKKIHVHCAANKRVCVFLGLYFLLWKGRPEIEAFELMRSIWEPDPIWSDFISEMQKTYSYTR